MIPTIDFAVNVIKRLYGDAAVILHIDDSNKCIDVFFRDCKGVMKEYFQAPNCKYVISNI